jgi:hypothetical protein
MRIYVIYCIHLRMAVGAETCCDTERYNNIKIFLIAIAGICLKDSYVYIMQQDAPHKNKM